MSKSLILIAIVAFGAAAAYQTGARNELDKKHGHGGGDHGHHHGPPPPETMRFKALFFVHSTFCNGLPLPNFTRPDGANDTRMSPRKSMAEAGQAFRQILADSSDSERGSDSDSSSSDDKSDVRPKPNETVRAKEATLSRTVMRAAASVVLSQKEGSSDDLCKALVKAEQAWIDYRKANNMSCGGHEKHHGQHGPHGAHGPRPPIMDGTTNMPPITNDPPVLSAAVMRSINNNSTQNGNKPLSKFQQMLEDARRAQDAIRNSRPTVPPTTVVPSNGNKPLSKFQQMLEDARRAQNAIRNSKSTVPLTTTGVPSNDD